MREQQVKLHPGFMRGVLQRAAGAQVKVDGEVVGSFSGPGIMLLVGV
ncbi:MAG: D-Tyr-tRNA(Tyr) deacylase, partial [Actinomycetota bacterium]